MHNLENLLNFDKNIIINQVDDDCTLTLPFKFFNGESIISLHIQKNQAGYYEIDDNGSTLKYLNNIDANPQDYKDKIEIICTLFSLKIEKNLVKGIIGYGTNQIQTQLFNYLQGLSHLSTLKFFD